MYDPIKVGTASISEILQGIFLAVIALYLGAWGTALLVEGWDGIVQYNYSGNYSSLEFDLFSSIETLAVAGPKYLIFNACAGWGIPTLLLVGLAIRQVVFKEGSRKLWGLAVGSCQLLAGIFVGMITPGWENFPVVEWTVEKTNLDATLLLVYLGILGTPLAAAFGVWLVRRLYLDSRDGPEDEGTDLVTLRREWGSGR